MNTDQLIGTIVYLDDDFGISYQETTGDRPQCHFQVNNWSPSIARRCKVVVDDLMREYRRDVMGIAHPEDRKHHKFLRLIGFRHYRNRWIIQRGEDAVISIWLRDFTGDKK